MPCLQAVIEIIQKDGLQLFVIYIFKFFNNHLMHLSQVAMKKEGNNWVKTLEAPLFSKQK